MYRRCTYTEDRWQEPIIESFLEEGTSKLKPKGLVGERGGRKGRERETEEGERERENEYDIEVTEKIK